VIDVAGAGALLIDSSTIDVGTAREVAAAPREEVLPWWMPGFGGRRRRGSRTLTFMVGGLTPLACALPISKSMGKDIVTPAVRATAGCEDLQQYDSRRVDDLGVGSLPAGEKSALDAKVVRYRLEVGRAVLVDDELLPVPGPVRRHRQPRLSGRIYAAMMLKTCGLPRMPRAPRRPRPARAAARSSTVRYGQGHAGRIFPHHPILRRADSREG